MSRLVLLVLALLGSVGVTSAQEPDLYDDTVVRTINLEFAQADWWDQLVRNKDQENGRYIEADMRVDGLLYPRVGVRMRGRASYAYSNGIKLPFKIKVDEYIPGQDLYGYDSLRLNNGWEDPTFCRDVAMPNLLRQYMPMPRSCFVQLTLNGGNWGVYVSEQQKDPKWLREWWEADTGNRYKSVQGGNLSYLGPTPPPYQTVYENKAENNPDQWTDLIHFCDVINNGPTGPDLTDDLWQILDIDATIWMIAGDNVFGNGDSYYFNRNNFYVFHDDHHGLLELVNHDLGLSFGTWDREKATLDPFYDFDSTLIPLVERMFQDSQLRQEYLAHVRTLVEDVFRPDIVLPLFERYRTLIQPYVYADTKKIFSSADFDRNFTDNVQGRFFDIPGLIPYVNDRYSFLTNHSRIDQPGPVFDRLQHSPQSPRVGDPVTVTAEFEPGEPVDRVHLRWRVRGPFTEVEMFDDGLHDDGAADDGIYGAIIPAQNAPAEVSYYAVAKHRGSRVRVFEPRGGARASTRVFVEGGTGFDVVVNEFLASNESSGQDEDGDHDDWIELYNSGNGAVDLSGMYLTDDLDDPTGWQIPAGTIVAAGERLLIWADDDPDAGPYHATFKLSASGESIGFFQPDGATVIEAVAFGPQQTDVSTGRLFDGSEPWVTLREPTPNANNQDDCGVRHFSALELGRNAVHLQLSGIPTEGEVVSLAVSSGPPSGAAGVFIGVAPSYLDLPGRDALLISLSPSIPIPLLLDGNGEASVAGLIPDDGSVVGIPLYFQTLARPAGGPILMSNAVELVVCPGS